MNRIDKKCTLGMMDDLLLPDLGMEYDVAQV